jgi:hypothetical protein
MELQPRTCAVVVVRLCCSSSHLRRVFGGSVMLGLMKASYTAGTDWCLIGDDQK